MHDFASILDSIAKGTSCFHYFSHPYVAIHSFFTLVSHIFHTQLRACAR